MLPALQQQILRHLDRIASKRSGLSADHLETGERGEREALLHLRTLGYVVVAHRWRSPKHFGDLDLIAWDGDELCFIEIKTRSQRDLSPASFAIDDRKQRILRRMARAWMSRFPAPLRETIPARFDALSVYLLPSGTEFELSRRAFAWS